MRTLYIQKLATLIDENSTAHKHLEPIAFAYAMQHEFDRIVIASNHATKRVKNIANIEIVGDVEFMIALQHATFNDAALLWQDCLDWLNPVSDEATKLSALLVNWNNTNARRFALTTDLRYGFTNAQIDKIATIFGVKLSNCAKVTEIIQSQVRYQSVFEKQFYVPLQINAAVLPMQLRLHGMSTMKQDIQKCIEAWKLNNVESLKQIKRYHLCFSSAGMNGLDKHRYDIVYKYMLQYNAVMHKQNIATPCNFITTHIDKRLSELTLQDSTIKAPLTFTWQVPYEKMHDQLSQSCCQLIAGDALYDNHRLVTNKFVEGILAETCNVVVGTHDIVNDWLRSVQYNADMHDTGLKSFLHTNDANTSVQWWHLMLGQFVWSANNRKMQVAMQWHMFEDWSITFFNRLHQVFEVSK